MSLTDRDRKIVTFLLPVVVLAVYWFLLLAPKREESAKLDETLTQAQSDRDAAVARADQAEGSRAGFEQDYAALVRLGKAVPSTVDMPSLLVQLDRAAAGTDIRFQRISAGERTTASTTATTPPSSASAAAPAGDAAAGGSPASSAPGQAAEQAGEAAQTADAASAAAGADSATSTGGSSPAPATGAPAPGALDSVPLEFTFKGSFFDLADFFHDLKRFVRLSGGDVDVRGRLMTISSLTLTPTDFPQIQAQVNATVYLSPKTQGVTAGATPQGPAPATDATTPTPAAAADEAPSPTSTATAAAQ